MQSEKISRHQFLKSLGLSGSALMAVYCSGAVLSSCSTNNATITPNGGTLTLDLTATANAALKNSGGYIIQNDIVVANVGGGSYVAVTHICSHEGLKQVVFQNGEFYCTAHGARYNTAGKGLNSNGNRGLTVYPTSLNGTTLTVG